jgi:hypothetical protein
MSDRLVETNDSDDCDDPDGQGLSGAVEVNVLVARNSSFVSGYKQKKTQFFKGKK